MNLFDLFKNKKNKANNDFVYPSEIKKIKSYDKRILTLTSYWTNLLVEIPK